VNVTLNWCTRRHASLSGSRSAARWFGVSGHTDGLARSCPGDVVRIDDMLVTTDKGHHLLRLLETVFEGPLVIYVRLDRERSNLALARHRLQNISSALTTK
ncbi:hypothetical protein AB0M50_56240, partial [Nonomuraea fuscirosea]